jgi:hypothetical protein
MKRMFSTLVVIVVVALSAVSVASAREWYLPIPQAKQTAPAKHLKKISKTNYLAYYRGPH